MYSVHEMPCTLSTTPIWTFSSSRIGPCSICSSTKACGLSAPGSARAGIADAAQLVADRNAVLVGGGIGLVQPEPAGVDQAAHHVGLEARALLVGEEGDGDRPARRDLGLVQRAHDFEAGQHAVIAVVAAAGAHRVDVAAGHDRREVLARRRERRSRCRWHRCARRGPTAFIQPTTRSRPALSSSVSASRAQPPPSMAPICGQFVERAEQALFIDTQHDFPNDAKTLDLCTGQAQNITPG